ncbi:MAG: hypothetical protein A2648_01085 [Candidatus Lloydbacteria bacterium RIFCSPHIGHO2_01_FULL_41_20]|uniref:Uncharacterized protein n=1 Tax=Candidatus Lloydbacteria bacterium RIFCSPHIGHO2_01_FULL_41_20 TaxID=1798657 RepID=A0A1G2CSH0_9BACT|nr:MAG: hypothetical protein A2648_01085 [Candidatus Lloydbacteria bacterium RIFCSPHIGHO2_01_FULL_41_20]
MNYTNEQLEKAVQDLPEEFQEAIASSHITTKVREIGNRYKLNAVQSGKLTDNAMLAALGLIDSINFSETLSKDIAIPVSQAQLIVGDVNKIFEEIRKSIQERASTPENEEEILVEPKEVLPEQEEILHRADVLHGIENPEPARQNFVHPPKFQRNSGGQGQNLGGQAKPPVAPITSAPVVKKETINITKTETAPAQKVSPPTPAPVIPIGDIAEQKLAQPFKIESKETEVRNTPTTDNQQPTIKKVDPYRETI